jgi:pimeloyl-ACP methyl ester carboxylesterase
MGDATLNPVPAGSAYPSPPPQGIPHGAEVLKSTSLQVSQSQPLKTTATATLPAPSAAPKNFGKDFPIKLGEHRLNLHAHVYLPATPNKNSQTFVLIHGFQSSWATFARIAPLLQKQGHTVYALDLPGHGKSERPKWFNYSRPDWYAEAIQGFLLTAHLKDVHLVGHSMGGGISTLFALKHPEQISQLTLLSPWSKDIFLSTFGKTWPFSWVSAGILWSAPERNMKRGLRDTSWDKRWIRDNKLMEEFTHAIDREDVEISFPGLLQDTVEMDWDKLEQMASKENIAKLKKKVEKINVFYGENDTLIPQGHVEDLAKKLGTEVITVKNTGHVFPLEAPEVASYFSGNQPVTDKTVLHLITDGAEEKGDYYGGPYFQWGLRGGFQTNLSAKEMNLPGQIFFNVDPDHYHSFQPGLEFGAQLNTPIKNSPWAGSAFVQPKFYWFRNTWLELSTGLTPAAGAGDFTGAGTPLFFSLDANVLKPEFILLNGGFLFSVSPTFTTNLYHSQKKEGWNFSDRNFSGLVISLSQ